MPSADRLQEFVAAVDAGSISAAATRLGIPRATLSRRLAELEDELGVPLLHRSPRGLGVTSAGSVLLSRARAALLEIASTWRAVRQLQDTPQGPLRVSVPPTVMLQDFFVKFALTYPEIDILVFGEPRQVDLVTEGFDVAMRIGVLRDDTVVARPIWSERYSLVASPAYLNAKGHPQAVHELATHRCILSHPQSGLEQREWPLLDGGSVGVHASVVVTEFVMGLHAAISGVGIMLLPEPMTQYYREQDRLVSVLPDRVGRQVTCYVAYPDRNLLPHVRAFVDFAIDYFKHGARPAVQQLFNLQPANGSSSPE
ncbi:MAG: LysR family transcriptional regulator [Myxococcota bacterium]